MSLVFYLTNEKIVLDCVLLYCVLCVVSLLLLYVLPCLALVTCLVLSCYGCLVSQVTVRVTVTLG